MCLLFHTAFKFLWEGQLETCKAIAEPHHKFPLLHEQRKSSFHKNILPSKNINLSCNKVGTFVKCTNGYVSKWGALFDTKVTVKFRVTFVSKRAPYFETYPNASTIYVAHWCSRLGIIVATAGNLMKRPVHLMLSLPSLHLNQRHQNQKFLCLYLSIFF